MTEQEWLTSADPQPMLDHLKVQFRLPSDHKLRLFACACIAPADCRYYTEYQIMHAAGEDLRVVLDHMLRCYTGSDYAQREEVVAQGNAAKAALLREVFGNPWRPIHPLAVHPHWLTWNDCIVMRLVQAAYDDRRDDGTLDPDRLAVLADALEEAGCTEEAMLRHLRGWEPEPWLREVATGKVTAHGWKRSDSPHVRGCFVLDLLLGKE